MPVDYMSMFGMPKMNQFSTMDNTGLAANLNTTNPNAATLAATPGMSNSGPVAPAGMLPGYVQTARDWINREYGGTTGADGSFVPGGWQFNGDFRPTGSLATNLAGAAQAMGYTDSQLAEILGLPLADVMQYRDTYLPDQYTNDGYRNSAVDRASLQFALDNGLTTRDAIANYQSDNGSRFGYTPDGFNDPMRTTFGTIKYQYGTDANGNPVMLPGQGDGGGRSRRDMMRQDGGPNGGMPMGGLPAGSNPYLQAMAGAMGTQWSDWLNETAMPQIRDSAVASGGIGSAGSGVAQGIATGKAATGYAGELAKLYGGAWESDQNRQLSQQQIENNFFTSQRGQDLQQLGLGYEMLNGGINGEWNPLTNYSNILRNYTGLGGQSTTSGSTGGGGLGFLGGALGAGQFANNMGWFR